MAFGRVAIPLAALALVWVGGPALAGDEPAAARKACLVVDTDVGLDDYRAFAVATPSRPPRGGLATGWS